MQSIALEVIKILENHGYSAYIVGGYVRDYLLGIETMDVDICTNAKPKEIMDIFETVPVSSIQYGSVSVIYKNHKFDITTFRKEIKYEDNRKPVKIKYIDNVKKDLLRRDFTINTLCMDKDGKVLDFLNVRDDLDKRIIKTVGNPRYRIKEDALRILRAIRFATRLKLTIDDKTKHYLKKYGYLLKKLSYERKKQELNKIFSSSNREIGKRLILELKLDKYLEIPNLSKTVMVNDIIGIWSQLDVDNIYPFSKIEKGQMEKIRSLLKKDVYDPYVIYQNGLYLCMVGAMIKGLDKTKINAIYNGLAIESKKDIVVKPNDIMKALKREPGTYLKDIMKDIEREIVYGKIDNSFDDIMKYVLKNYK